MQPSNAEVAITYTITCVLACKNLQVLLVAFAVLML